MSSYFNLISHPDRSLESHLNRCNSISNKLLEMKYISNSFYKKEQLEYWRLLFVYFHDFGKSTDFFQKKIIDAIDQENSKTGKLKVLEFKE